MSEYADLILLSNCIFTATEEIPFSGYIAIKKRPDTFYRKRIGSY